MLPTITTDGPNVTIGTETREIRPGEGPVTIEGWNVSRSETGGFTFEPPKTSTKFQNNFVGGKVGTVMQAGDIGHLDLR